MESQTCSEMVGVPEDSNGYRKGYLNSIFMSEMLPLVQNPNHPLHKLYKETTDDWTSRAMYSHDPTVQAGHLVSRHSDLEERFALEDSTFNQWSSNVGETQGAIFVKQAVLIRLYGDNEGVPVERRTAELWERVGILPPGTLANPNLSRVGRW